MPSADFCSAVRQPYDRLSRLRATRSRPPGVSSIAFGAQPPDLRFASLMDMDFATSCPLVRRWRLVSGFCSSARTFAPRFLQTPPRGGSPCASMPCGNGNRLRLIVVLVLVLVPVILSAPGKSERGDPGMPPVRGSGLRIISVGVPECAIVLGIHGHLAVIAKEYLAKLRAVPLDDRDFVWQLAQRIERPSACVMNGRVLA